MEQSHGSEKEIGRVRPTEIILIVSKGESYKKKIIIIIIEKTIWLGKPKTEF